MHRRTGALYYPMITPQGCMSQLDLLELDRETRELFLHENAKRVFQLT